MVEETSEALNYCDFIGETRLPLVDLVQVQVNSREFRPGWQWQLLLANRPGGEGDGVSSDEQRRRP